MTSSARALWRYAESYRSRYVIGAACLLAATAFALAIPWTVKHAIDDLQAHGAATPLLGYVAAIVAMALGNGVCRMGSRFAIMGAAQRIEYDVRNDLYSSFQAGSPRFFAAHPTGDLMARASSDVATVKMLTGFGVVSLAGTTFAFVGAVLAMVAVDPWLTLWAMAPYPALVLLAKRFTAVVHARTQAMQDALGVLSSRLQEHLAGMAVVRAYTMEPHAAGEFARANGQYFDASLAVGRVQAAFTPLMGLISGIGTVVVLWAGGKAVVDGRLSLGALVAFNGYLGYLAWPTVALGWTLSVVRRGLTSMERIQDILHANAEPARVTMAAPRDTAIRFADLTFAYDGRSPALSEVSFEVGAGETVAVVGPTGSGKSTLGLVLARLWEPPPGTVFVGGSDVTAVDRETLRARLGYVPQDGFLFSRSIADNVTLGRETIGLGRLREALIAAGVADEIARFPEGVQTVVGERGLTLSGGQRQRVTLARALAGAPAVLILDDVFASVDVEKEEEIVANLRQAATGRTVLLMTHRLRAARAADRIIVLADGRVVEAGTHEALVRGSGLYARLWRMQQIEEEIARA